MNVVLLPYFTLGGELEAVPGAERVTCMCCPAALTATPTSLAAASDGSFLCLGCATQVLPFATEPLRRPEGAANELRAAGLGDVADNDEALLRRLQGGMGVN